MDEPFDINKKRPGPWDKGIQVGDKEVSSKKIKCRRCKKDHDGTMNMIKLKITSGKNILNGESNGR